jgi:hypothetical protein
MSATSAPFGLRPAFHPSGLDRAQALAGGIASGYGSNILKGQPVAYNPGAGNIIALTTSPAAGSAEAWSGAFAGVEWTDTTGRRSISNYWPANTAYQTGSCIAYFYNDRNIVYEIQTSSTLTQASIGNEYNFNNTTVGSTVTGLSRATLNPASAAGNNNQGQMRVVDLAPYQDNAWGDAYVIVRVVNCQSQFFGSVTAIA